ncbi:MAG: alpha-E domain-containing protein [Planctomycetes bacterium]|nr:alpha-E domain-containing protein [Planctomycetota bacterium]
MLSRVADSIYWMSRYIERAENLARMIDAHLTLVNDLSHEEQWMPLVAITGDDAVFKKMYGEPERDAVIEFLTFNTDYPNSIVSTVRAARENARSVRETITAQMWEQLNEFYLMVTGPDARRQVDRDPYGFYQMVKLASHLFLGVTDSTMTHNEGWHFGKMGRLMERADKTSRILDVKYFLLLPSPSHVGTPMDDAQWASLLHSINGFEMYRQQHGTINPLRVAEFLILDRRFPRAIRHCIEQARLSLYEISGTRREEYTNEAERRFSRLVSELSYARIEQVVSGGLHEFLDSFQTKLNAVGHAIHETFFALQPIEPEPEIQMQYQSARTYDILLGNEA